jgi:hypothetical protein
MDSRAHPGSNVTGVYEKLYVAQSLKVILWLDDHQFS